MDFGILVTGSLSDAIGSRSVQKRDKVRELIGVKSRADRAQEERERESERKVKEEKAKRGGILWWLGLA